MPFDEQLAARVRGLLGNAPGLTERRMFGGIGFMLHGNMACGVHGPDLIVRVGANAYQAALAQPGARPFDMTGRPMTGWVQVDSQTLGPDMGGSDVTLAEWVAQGQAYALSLPPK